ncbi:hypothetical protein [Labedella endophytica]|uniref:Tryptophan synthase subunit alpha n=1 Tax=Labedella endophytica TaxID=1523160 RepID=A0A3S0X8F1_9MICO|nr:hypothetical protein [Labedella endophytica]RUQ98100.1 hypothetical protein ELQ94_13820 [Labedella endophytica]
MMVEQDIARLREFARDELDVLIEHRSRQGEDPWDFLPDMPTVDELVVLSLRDDALDDRGLTAEYVLTRLAARSTRSDAEEHRRALERIDADIIRSIGIAYPALTRTAWMMLGRFDLGDGPDQPAP